MQANQPHTNILNIILRAVDLFGFAHALLRTLIPLRYFSKNVDSFEGRYIWIFREFCDSVSEWFCGH
jgi:hypothetical protein